MVVAFTFEAVRTADDDGDDGVVVASLRLTPKAANAYPSASVTWCAQRTRGAASPQVGYNVHVALHDRVCGLLEFNTSLSKIQRALSSSSTSRALQPENNRLDVEVVDSDADPDPDDMLPVIKDRNPELHMSMCRAIASSLSHRHRSGGSKGSSGVDGVFGCLDTSAAADTDRYVQRWETTPADTRSNMPPSSSSSSEPLVHRMAGLQCTGEALYTSDIPPSVGALHAFPVCSTMAYATITSIDASAAVAMPGVIRVLTAADLPCNVTGPIEKDEVIFAQDRVTHHGQVLAVVVATTERLARRAAAAVKVTLQPVVTAAAATATTAAAADDDDGVVLTRDVAAVTSVELAASMPSQVRPPPATFSLSPHRGDVQAVWSRACASGNGGGGSEDGGSSRHDGGGGGCAAREEEEVVTVSEQLRVGGQLHYYMETNACIVTPGEGGVLDVHATSQHPCHTQATVAEALGLPHARVRVTTRRLGGGFGGKGTRAWPFVVAALAAHVTRKQVRLVLDRSVDSRATGPRADTWVKYRIGIQRSGKVVAVEVDFYSNQG